MLTILFLFFSLALSLSSASNFFFLEVEFITASPYEACFDADLCLGRPGVCKAETSSAQRAGTGGWCQYSRLSSWPVSAVRRPRHCPPPTAGAAPPGTEVHTPRHRQMRVSANKKSSFPVIQAKNASVAILLSSRICMKKAQPVATSLSL